MLKLLLCLFCSAAAAMMLLELREQRLNLTFQTNLLHNQIEATQAQLWNQQLNIAICTAPSAIAQTVKGNDMKLAAPTGSMRQRAWMDDPNAAAE
jgi:hypothetical protein